MDSVHRRIHYSLRTKLFLVYTLPMLILIGAFLLYNSITVRARARDEYLQYQEQLSRQLLRQLEEQTQELRLQINLLYGTTTNLQALLAGPLQQGYYRARDEIRQLISAQIWENESIDGMAILSAEGDIILQWNRANTSTNTHNSKDEDWFRQTLSLRGQPLFRAGHRNLFSRETAGVISCSRSFHTAARSKPIAVVVAYTYLERLPAVFAGVADTSGGWYRLVGEDGGVLYESGTGIKDGMLTLSVESETLGWTLTSYAPSTVIDRYDHALFGNLNFLILFALVAISFGLSSVMGLYVTRPLRRFAVSFRQVEQGDFHAAVSIKGSDELSMIANAYNSMLEKTRLLIRERYELTLAKTQSELETLQSQINPHFLFNTLNSIRCVIETGDTRQSGNMIQALSDLLRYSLGHGKNLVSFRQELESARKYLYLQQCRYGERYSVRYDIDPAVLSLSIPRLTLQPLLENAIRHGLEKSAAPQKQDELILTARRAGEDFLIYVANTGPQIPPEKLAGLNAQLQASTPKEAAVSERVGIMNIHHRLQLHYGELYGLRISSVIPYTTVRLRLPCTTADNENEKEAQHEDIAGR